MSQTKTCSKCGETKPATTEYFREQKNKEDGLQIDCKICRQKYDQERRARIKVESGFIEKIPSEGMKYCSRCGKELPATAEYFNNKKLNKDGLTGSCKKCLKEFDRKRLKNYNEVNKEHIAKTHKKYQQNNKEQIRAQRKIFNQGNAEKRKIYEKENKERIAAVKKAWREENLENIVAREIKYRHKNKEKINAKAKIYYGENKEIIAGKMAIWQKNNREHINKYMAKYAQEHPGWVAKKDNKRRSLKMSLPSTLTISQWERTKEHFENCCAYCGEKLPLAQEHFKPISNKGEYSHNNIICACKSCNSSKRDKDFFTWYPTYKHYSPTREKKILSFLHYKNGIQQLSMV